MGDEKSKRIPEFPLEDSRSVGFHVAMGSLDAVASLVPGGGYGVQQLVKQFIGEPLEKRREAWFTMLGEGLQDLQDHLDGFNPAALGENEEFVSVVYEATQMAMRTHHDEKREALKNAVLNTAAGIAFDDVVRGSFMDYVNRFSILHIKVLRLLQDPTKSPAMCARVANMMAGGLETLITAALPNEVAGGLVAHAFRDLSSANLVIGSLNVTTSTDGLMEKRTTQVGDAFLRFISSPVETR